jgi:multidrug efflux pump subunit AcrA (membrane-fusion protein)
VQTALVAGLLGARGAALWLGKGTLELAWSQGLSPQDIPPNRFQEFLKKCLSRAVERNAPFLATDKIGSEEFAFLFVPFGSPLRGIAVFSGPKSLWDRFQSARSTILPALGMLAENGVQLPRHIAIPLVRSRGLPQTAGICADHLCALLGAKRVSILRLGGKKARLLACSGASSIDRHSPEVAAILSNFSALEKAAGDSSLVGGPLSKWCAHPEAAGLGVLVENPTNPAAGDVLAAEAALVAHAIESKRHPLAALLFPSAAADDSRRRKYSLLRAALVAGIVCTAAVLFFPVPRIVSGQCELVPSRRASIVAQVPGRIETVFAKEGSVVSKGTPLFQIDDSTLRSRLEIAEQQFGKAEAEVRLRRGEGDMQTLRSAELEKQRLTAEISALRRDLSESLVVSPLEGAVLSKDLDLLRGEFVQPGTLLCDVASLENWDLQIRVPEADAGPLERALQKGRTLPVRYALQARADITLRAGVSSTSEISQMVYPENGAGFVYVTLRGIDLPQELLGEIRPGFSGFAKIEAGRLPLARNLFERSYHFLRLRFFL